MNKQKAIELAEKIVDKFATHERIEVDDTSKEYELDESMDTADFQFDKTKHHVFRFLELGYSLTGADKDKATARAEIVDVIAADLATGSLELSDDWIAENVEK